MSATSPAHHPVAAEFAVSVVIPAFQAAETIRETLDSLRAQSWTRWEALVVDDGSTDSTLEIVREVAAEEPRLRLLEQPHLGVSTARNLGLRNASHPWVAFLDSDDLLLPHHLEVLVDALRADPSATGAYGGWRFLTSTGDLVFAEQPDLGGDLFDAFARCCVFTIHSIVLRREVCLEVGGFDPEFVTCEDWDLFLRVARTGARFVAVPRIVATYRLRKGSATMDGVRLWRDGSRLFDIGRAGDPRVPRPAPAHARGSRDPATRAGRYYYLAWCGALEIAAGRDPRRLFDSFAAEPQRHLDPHLVAQQLFRGALQASTRPASGWARLWPEIRRPLLALAHALGQRAGVAGFAGATLRELQRLVASHLERETDVEFGDAHLMALEVTRPIPEVSCGRAIARLVAQIRLGGVSLGCVELPVFDGAIPAWLLSDAVAGALAWPLLESHFRRTIYPRLATESLEGDWLLRRDDIEIGRYPGPAPRTPAELEQRVRWLVLLQEIWNAPRRHEGWFYDPQDRGDEPGRTLAAGLEAVDVEITDSLPRLELSESCATVRARLAGVPLSLVVFENGPRTIPPAELRAAITRSAGAELAHATAREAILGHAAADPTPLGERLRRRARLEPRDRSGTGWRISHRRPERPDGPASRRARLPLAELASVRRATDAAREAIEPTPSEGAAGIAYDPSSLPATRSLRRPEAIDDAPVDDPAARTARLPILLYHSISDDGDSRWTVSPRRFADQMAWLAGEGYRTVSLDLWRRAMERHEPIPGRAVVLTFDDGFTDLVSTAQPIFARHGFHAVVFVVAGKVGATSDWERGGGARVRPLLDWPALRELESSGCAIGAHGYRHEPLVRLRPAKQVRELALTRAMLYENLSRPAPALAYPYGLSDSIVRHLAGAIGFDLGLTVRPGRAGLWVDPLDLPRIEIGADDDLDAFVRRFTGD